MGGVGYDEVGGAAVRVEPCPAPRLDDLDEIPFPLALSLMAGEPSAMLESPPTLPPRFVLMVVALPPRCDDSSGEEGDDGDGVLGMVLPLLEPLSFDDEESLGDSGERDAKGEDGSAEDGKYPGLLR